MVNLNRFFNGSPALFEDFFEDFNRIFTNGTHEAGISSHQHTEDGVTVLEFELPGVAKEDIEVKVVDHNLHVNVVQSQDDKNDTSYVLRELYPVELKRSYRIPSHLDATSLKAEYVNGVLRVALSEKAKEERTIQITD
ncbi:MAG: Hsp20/alpha crystallin family protein [Lentisphaeria bacterium]|nr:Hsp20/alpha crystallin family protein [Lentisphaeria bacterium]